MRPKIGFKLLFTERFYEQKQYYKWDGQPMRAPKKGEYFISGCSGHELAYEAKQDMTMKYFIAVPSGEYNKPKQTGLPQW